MKLTEALRNADRIGLIGSCTAREVKELACSPGVKASYIWRSNTISMMSDPISRPIDMTVAGLQGGEPQTVRGDFYKTDLAAFLAGHPLVLMDLFRDTYDLMTDGTTFVTRGQEWDRIAATHNLADFQMVSVYAKTYPALWLRQARQMADRINRSGAVVILVPASLTHIRLEDVVSQGRQVTLLSADHFDIHYKSVMLACMEGIMAQLLDRCLLLPRPGALGFANPGHLYGLGPIHHFPALYRLMLELGDCEMTRALAATPSAAERAERATRLATLWQAQAQAGYPLP